MTRLDYSMTVICLISGFSCCGFVVFMGSRTNRRNLPLWFRVPSLRPRPSVPRVQCCEVSSSRTLYVEHRLDCPSRRNGEPVCLLCVEERLTWTERKRLRFRNRSDMKRMEQSPLISSSSDSKWIDMWSPDVEVAAGMEDRDCDSDEDGNVARQLKPKY